MKKLLKIGLLAIASISLANTAGAKIRSVAGDFYTVPNGDGSYALWCAPSNAHCANVVTFADLITLVYTLDDVWEVESPIPGDFDGSTDSIADQLENGTINAIPQ